MTWTRAPLTRRCGACGEPIVVGAPMAVLSIGRLTKVRCGACAGGPVPPDLPAQIEDADPPPLDFTRLGLLPFDWSRRTPLVGRERAPREEG